MALRISSQVQNKLTTRHGVSEDEILQCFANRRGHFLEDDREEHKTEPPTKWFIAPTDYGRFLKVVFIANEENDIVIKTAYTPNQDVARIYQKYGIKRGID